MNQSSSSSTSSSRKLEIARRIGYGAKGFLYGAFGILAVSSALGAGTQQLGFRDAIRWVADQPLGTVLLVALIAGLAAYSLYRFVCAFTGLETDGTGKKAKAKRIGYFGSALAYASLAVFTGLLIANAGEAGGSGGSKTSMIATLLDHWAGKLLLGGIALGLLGAALNQFYRAWTGKYRERFQMNELPDGSARFVNFSAKFGLTSRGIVFSLLGYLLAKAVIESNAAKAGGVETAFSWLSNHTTSSWILAVVAAGMVAYAIYAMAIAYCGRIRTAS